MYSTNKKLACRKSFEKNQSPHIRKGTAGHVWWGWGKCLVLQKLRKHLGSLQKSQFSLFPNYHSLTKELEMGRQREMQRISWKIRDQDRRTRGIKSRMRVRVPIPGLGTWTLVLNDHKRQKNLLSWKLASDSESVTDHCHQASAPKAFFSPASDSLVLKPDGKHELSCFIRGSDFWSTLTVYSVYIWTAAGRGAPGSCQRPNKWDLDPFRVLSWMHLCIEIMAGEKIICEMWTAGQPFKLSVSIAWQLSTSILIYAVIPRAYTFPTSLRASYSD